MALDDVSTTPRERRGLAGRNALRPTVLAAALACGAAALTAGDARADNVGHDAKGVVGGGLLGAEIVTITEGIAGARPWWAYLVGGVAGAAAGAVGGLFIEQASWSNDGRVPTYMLAGGLALIIPAVVLSLNATRYMPEEGATEDRTPTGPAAEPGTPGGGIVTPASSAPAPAPAAPPPAAAPTAPPPQSLLDVHEGAFRMGVPVPEVRPTFSTREQLQYGMQAQTELRMPVLHVAF